MKKQCKYIGLHWRSSPAGSGSYHPSLASRRIRHPYAGHFPNRRDVGSTSSPVDETQCAKSFYHHWPPTTLVAQWLWRATALSKCRSAWRWASRRWKILSDWLKRTNWGFARNPMLGVSHSLLWSMGSQFLPKVPIGSADSFPTRITRERTEKLLRRCCTYTSEYAAGLGRWVLWRWPLLWHLRPLRNFGLAGVHLFLQRLSAGWTGFFGECASRSTGKCAQITPSRQLNVVVQVLN